MTGTEPQNSTPLPIVVNNIPAAPMSDYGLFHANAHTPPTVRSSPEPCTMG